MSNIINEEYTIVPIDSLEPHPENPNEGDIGAIHTSIEENGFFGAVIVQRSRNRIIAGEHRWRADKHAGATEIPVIFIDVDDDRARRILLADNRLAELAARNKDKLATMLKDLLESSGSLDGTGYDGDDLDALLKELSVNMLGEGEAFGALPDGDKGEMETMSFVLHNTQAAEVRAALDAVRELGEFDESLNTNKNGNALHRVAMCALQLVKGKKDK